MADRLENIRAGLLDRFRFHEYLADSQLHRLSGFQSFTIRQIAKERAEEAGAFGLPCGQRELKRKFFIVFSESGQFHSATAQSRFAWLADTLKTVYLSFLTPLGHEKGQRLTENFFLRIPEHLAGALVPEHDIAVGVRQHEGVGG